MATWGQFAEAEPELAALAAERFQTAEVAYLATVKPDGRPRVHPVTSIIGEERLFLFMEPTSPKGHDLRRDGHYALHSLVTDQDGSGGEFLIRGKDVSVEEPSVRAIASKAAAYDAKDRYVLFELSVDEASSTVYDRDGQPVRRRWRGLHG